ncbi:MAG: riboflavin biosynthesis protein RibF, partial [Clostridia bacterium]|nr:riboflavin biosynthesis protein RibF [Clostridia bacterium]
MKIIRNLSDLNACSIALGNFDGVHIAHKRIIEKCREYAKNNGILSGVLLFENHTQTVLEDKTFKVLSPLSEKIEMIEELGVDFIFIKSFDEDTMKMKKGEFFQFLTVKMKAKALFAGYD